jgi:Protein of unknown function (DUF4012)
MEPPNLAGARTRIDHKSILTKAMRAHRLVTVGILALAAGGVVVALQARGDATAVERDLDQARLFLVEVGRLDVGTAGHREALTRRAEARALAARRRLDGWPLGPLSATPILGRDVRTAEAVTESVLKAARGAGRVAAALGSVERRPSAGSVSALATALLDLSAALGDGAERVERARTLLAGRARSRFVVEARSAQATSLRAGRGLRVAAGLYGPRGSVRYFLAFQNPTELRGTGGLIGEYGILEASPAGPVVRQVRAVDELRRRLRGSVPPPSGLPAHYRRAGVTRDWRVINIPPDLPTVGRMIVALYRKSGGERVDGVILVDPLAMARILRVSGPIEVRGMRLGSRTLVKSTLLTAYVRYQNDNDGRRRFLGEVGLQGAKAARRALAARPVEFVRALGDAAQGRHLALYATDPAAQRIVLALGIGGTASAPDDADYFMPVGVNAGGNKVDYFLQRELSYDVRLRGDGAAHARAAITLHNGAPSNGLPRYVIGPFDGRFRPGENRILQSLHVSDAYGFTQAVRNNRRVQASANQSFRGLALTQTVSIPAGRSATIRYDLVRKAAVQIENGDIRYRLLLRPQPTVNPDRLTVAVSAPADWRFVRVPPGFAGDRSAVRWSGLLDRERMLEFVLVKTA